MNSSCGKYTVARILERDDFANRYKAGVPVSPLVLPSVILNGVGTPISWAEIPEDVILFD